MLMMDRMTSQVLEKMYPKQDDYAGPGRKGFHSQRRTGNGRKQMNIRKIPPYLTNAVQNSRRQQGNLARKKRPRLEMAFLQTGCSFRRIIRIWLRRKSRSRRPDEIRTEKVQQIKNQLESGNYQIKPDEIAGKMLDEII